MSKCQEKILTSEAPRHRGVRAREVRGWKKKVVDSSQMMLLQGNGKPQCIKFVKKIHHSVSNQIDFQSFSLLIIKGITWARVLDPQIRAGKK